MKNILYITLLLISLSFCSKKNENKELIKEKMNISNNKKYKNKAFTEIYNVLNESVSQCYNSPKDKLFKSKIFDIFYIDIDTSSFLDVALEVDLLPKTAIMQQNYIIPSLHEINFPYGEHDIKKRVMDRIKNKYGKCVCNYNKMIFYNDIHATTWIKANHPNYIIELITKYGYTGNEDWLKFTFSKTDFTDVNRLDELLFGIKIFSSRRTESGEPKDFKQYLRKDMLEKMVEHKVEYSQFATLAHMTEKYPDRYIEEPNEIVARLYDATYRMGGYGLLEYLYDRKISYKETFKDHDYYGLEALRKYSETIYKPEHERGSTSGRAVRALCVINDPDGYTNVRKAPSSSGEILFRINEGEEFTVELENPAEEWWHVVSPKYGYIHKSRVKIIKKYGDW